VRFLELGGGLPSQFGTLLLAELGHEVIKVEPPGGHEWRPRRELVPDDYSFEYLNRRKRSLTLDLDSERGRDTVLRLAASTDGVIEDIGPGGLDNLGLGYSRLRAARPEIVVASISSWGASGPHSDWDASEIAIQAAGGIVIGTGWNAEPPVKLAGYPASCIAGINAATVTLAAALGVAGGEAGGVHFDISAQEAFMHHWTRHIAQWAYSGTGIRRETRVQGRQGFPHTVVASDGWLYILALNAEWEPLAYFLGLDQFVTHEWSDARTRARRWGEIEPHFYASIQSRGRYDWFADAAAQGYTFAPIDTSLDTLKSPHLASRGFFEQTEIGGREVQCPSLPFSFDLPERRPNRVPEAGEDNEALLRELGLPSAAVGDEQRHRRNSGGSR
jgi:CoA:oxalate CoA-transferase